MSGVILPNYPRATRQRTRVARHFQLPDPLSFAGMVIEPHPTTFDIRHVGQNIIVRNFDQAVLQVFGVGEFVFGNQPPFFKQHRTDQAVEI